MELMEFYTNKELETIQKAVVSGKYISEDVKKRLLTVLDEASGRAPDVRYLLLAIRSREGTSQYSKVTADDIANDLVHRDHMMSRGELSSLIDLAQKKGYITVLPNGLLSIAPKGDKLLRNS